MSRKFWITESGTKVGCSDWKGDVMRTLSTARMQTQFPVGSATKLRKYCMCLMYFALVVITVNFSETSALGSAILWDGGNGNWFGPWLGTLPGVPIPFPQPITNWGCEYCYPAPGDTVNIGTLYNPPIGAVTGTVNLTSSTTVAGVALGVGAFGGLQVSSGTLTVTGGIDAGTFAPGSGSLTISSLVNTGFAWLGVVSGTNGFATVTGSGSQLNVSGSTEFLVGRQGTGTLSVQSGGSVTSNGAVIGELNGSSGLATITGVGSHWTESGTLTVGSVGQGTLVIQSGGRLNSGGISLGDQGEGTLNIQSGGIVTNTYANMGIQAGSTGRATVTGPGSQWNNSSALVVGQSGNSVLNITNGAMVSDARPTPTESAAVIGLDSGSNGTVNVSGAGSAWINNGPLNVGYSGSGTLTISNNAEVETAIFLVGSQAGSSGSVAIQSGAELINAGSAFVGGVSGSTSDVTVDAAAWTNTGPLFIGTSGPGSVTLSDHATLTASDITVGSNGTLTIDPSTVDAIGNFTLSPGGILVLDIAGSALGDFSQLDISGTGTFGGAIDYEFISGFAPQAGEAFDLINADHVNLGSATIDIEGLRPGFEYTETFSNGELSLIAVNTGISTAPEPNTAWLLTGALGVLILAVGASKRSSQKNTQL